MALSDYLVYGKTNICFDCKNACGDCSWSENFEPVSGWTATPSYYPVCSAKGKTTKKFTYHITACPEFIPDERVSLDG